MPCYSFLGPAAGRLTCIAVSLVRLPDTLGDLVSRASYPAKCPRLSLCVDFTLLVSPLPGQPEAKSLPQFVGLAYFFLAVATACKRFANHAQVDHIGFCNRTRCPRAVYGSSSNRPHRDHLQSWMSWPGIVSSKPRVRCLRPMRPNKWLSSGMHGFSFFTATTYRLCWVITRAGLGGIC